MMTLDTCALCRQEGELRASHIIPKFVGKWLKETSATGFLRGITEPDIRLQDLRKTNLLCQTCEERFSKLETYFASEIFFPFLEKGINSFKYDGRLLEFVMSLSWRTLLVSYDEFKQDVPSLCEYVDKAEETWREYLLGDSPDPGDYEHHIFFFDYAREGKDLPPGFQWYSLRAVDATLVSNGEKVLAYSKFPWIVFVSSIHPVHLEGWHGTMLTQVGEISQPQQIEDEMFGGFLVNRARMSLSKISGGVPSARILRSMRRRPERYLKSESLQVSFAEAKRAREVKKEKLPPSIRELIWIIEGAIEDESLTKLERQRRKLGLSILADAISRISDDDALKLASMIESTVLISRNTNEDSQCTFETEEFVMVFMVNLYFTKEEQRKCVATELEKLMSSRKADDKRHLMVFSWNPFEPDLPYESAFFIS